MELRTEKMVREKTATPVPAQLLRSVPALARLISVLVLLVVLSGCGSKNAGLDDPFAAAKSVPSAPVFLPDDDGKPLTSAELAAFTSTGDFDRNLSTEDLTDVLRHFKSLVHTNRRTVEVSVNRANVHIEHMRRVLRENGLPAELAYLPFVESNFNSMALSRSGALGMWQFMPRTGRYYGLAQDNWRDERRDPQAATRSAAAYLKKLNGDFSDWHLAVSAYNAGEGKIGRGLAATGATNFFELRKRDHVISEPKDQMTEENKQYLPRFLAVCKIMRNLSLLGFQPLNPVRTELCEITVQPGTDLLAFSKALDMDWDAFMQHNSAYLRYLSPPDYSARAYVPKALEARAVAWLRTAPKASATAQASMQPYRVVQGDTLHSIARKRGFTVAVLEKANPDVGILKVGQVLLLPSAAKGKTPALKTAAGIQTASTAASRETAVRPSQSSPAKTVAKTTAKTVAKSTVKPATPYKVQEGDTLWAIARKFQVAPYDLLALNNMDVSVKLKPGDVVMVMR